MSIHSYVGTPDNEVSVRVETIEDIVEGVDALHTLTLHNIEDDEDTRQKALQILESAISQLEELL